MRAPVWLLFALHGAAYACSCDPFASSVDQFHAADAVFLGTIDAVEDKRFPFENRGFIHGQLVTLTVNEAFKGLAANQTLQFENAFSSCSGPLEQGKQMLFRMARNPENGKRLLFGCGGVTPPAAAASNLAFLRAFRDRMPDKHRVAGAVELYESHRPAGMLAGVTVRLVSAGAVAKTLLTNSAGVFETYDLPAGTYRVVVKPPAGLKLGYPTSDVSFAWTDSSPSVELGLVFIDDLAIVGKIRDAAGKPLEEVCLALRSAEVDAPPHSVVSSCSKRDGSYRLEGMPPGAYCLVAHESGRVSARAPLPRTYYPGVAHQQDAHVIQLRRGQAPRELDFRLSNVGPGRVILRGRAQFADGSPAPWTEVKLTGIDDTRADENGEFTMFAWAGSTGFLAGRISNVMAGSDAAEAACSKAWRSEDILSNPVEITASAGQRDMLVVVTLPATSCKPWLDFETQRRNAYENRWPY